MGYKWKFIATFFILNAKKETRTPCYNRELVLWNNAAGLIHENNVSGGYVSNFDIEMLDGLIINVYAQSKEGRDLWIKAVSAIEPDLCVTGTVCNGVSNNARSHLTCNDDSLMLLSLALLFNASHPFVRKYMSFKIKLYLDFMPFKVAKFYNSLNI